MDAAERGVVNDALRAGYEWCEAREAFDRGFRFAAMVWDPGDVEDDAAMHVGVARRDEHELGTPRRFAVALEMQRGVSFEPSGPDLASLPIDGRVAPRCFEEWRDDFAVGVEHAGEVGMRPRSRTVGVEESEFAGLCGGDLTVQGCELVEDGGFGEVAVSAVLVVVAADRLFR